MHRELLYLSNSKEGAVIDWRRLGLNLRGSLGDAILT